jgi:hypothetical protein
MHSRLSYGRGDVRALAKGDDGAASNLLRDHSHATRTTRFPPYALTVWMQEKEKGERVVSPRYPSSLCEQTHGLYA